MRFVFALLLVWLSALSAGPSPDEVVSVRSLLLHAKKYAGRVLTIRGRVIKEHHGTALCDDQYEKCVQVVLPDEVEPRPEFTLVRDATYERFAKLALEVGLVERSLGRAALEARIFGRFDISGPADVERAQKGLPVPTRFVLARVAQVEVRRLGAARKPDGGKQGYDLHP
jgi:hypothetical protein